MKYLTGSCLCGKVKIRIADQFQYIGNCHCSKCRKFTGSAFSTAGGVSGENFRITDGEDFITYYQKTEQTDMAFCRQCGSSLFSRKTDRKIYNIRLGILDDSPTQKPSFHMYVGSKASWHEISDDLEKFNEQRNSLGDINQ